VGFLDWGLSSADKEVWSLEESVVSSPVESIEMPMQAAYGFYFFLWRDEINKSINVWISSRSNEKEKASVKGMHKHTTYIVRTIPVHHVTSKELVRISTLQSNFKRIGLQSLSKLLFQTSIQLLPELNAPQSTWLYNVIGLIIFLIPNLIYE